MSTDTVTMNIIKVNFYNFIIGAAWATGYKGEIETY